MGLKDIDERWPVSRTEIQARGYVQNYLEEDFAGPDGKTLTRQYVSHTGSVAVIALNEADEIAVVHQYRHPVRMRLVEPPAGLLDVHGEDPLQAAKRELAEEAQLQAETWHVLVDVMNSPGGSAEAIRVYLAQQLSPATAPEGFRAEGEELDMGLAWVQLDQLLAMIFAGEVENPALLTGVLALAEARSSGRELRPGDAPWPYLANLRGWLGEHSF